MSVRRASRRRRPIRDETGMVTSEFAVATIGACGVACVLLTLSARFDDMIRGILERGPGPILGGLM